MPTQIILRHAAEIATVGITDSTIASGGFNLPIERLVDREHSLLSPMSRGPTTFRQRDVTAAIKAVKKAGCHVGRVEVDKTGKIVVVTTKNAIEAPDGAVSKNEWDGAV